MNIQKISSSFRFSLLVLIAFVSAEGFSEPGQLSDTPLYMGDGVAPNIVYILDDSGSMGWSIMKTNDAENISAYSSYRNDGSIDITPNNTRERLENCAAYNAMAYNPEIEYTPWTGTDVDGNAFVNVTNLSSVYTDAYAKTGDEDISGGRFLEWTDGAHGRTVNQILDEGECGEGSVANLTNVSSLSATEAVNYANWYVYYRSRMNVLKTALSAILDVSNERVALVTINGNQNVATVMTDLSGTNAATVASRVALRQKTFALDTPGGKGTRLKLALSNTGRYFNALNGTTPDTSLHGTDYYLSNSASPITQSCQQNFAVLMTDGNYNDTDIDFSYATDAEALAAATSGNEDVGDLGDQDGDGEENTMADIAHYYYNTDLNTSMDNEVTSNNTVDNNSAQHMVTYGIAFGVTGEIPIGADPYSDSWGYLDDGDNVVDYGWPTGNMEGNNKSIDDLFHATYEGKGGFYTASAANELIEVLNDIRNSIVGSASGTAAAVGFNSTSISTGTHLYQAWFSTTDWSGQLRAYDFSSGDITDSTAWAWEAGEELADRDLTTTPRLLVTYSSLEETGTPDGVPDGSGIVFKAPTSVATQLAATVTDNGELNSSHLSDLLSHNSSPTDPADQETFIANLISWFQGTHDADTHPQFRDRDSKLLGDIIYSSPQYVGIPSAPYPNHIEVSNPVSGGDLGDAYDTFISAQTSRTPVVYVGSNDGMLHGFRASDGEELFAYMPEFLFTNTGDRGYHQLAEVSRSHVPFLDGTPTVGDVFVNSAWHTYLVSGLNGGGKGIVVLDVTTPPTLAAAGNAATAATAAESLAVMEFTHANLGYTYSRPQIGKLNNGEWVAIFGNGYNNSGSGEASLFILYLDGNDDDSNQPYKEISTGVGDNTAANCANCNGLSAPSIIDLNSDGVIDRVYAGDVQGNMWAFDLSADASTGWNVAHSTGGSPVPLFTACGALTNNCANDPVQPITAKPVVVAHADRSLSTTEPNLVVMFGTGQYIADGDVTNIDKQSFYAVWDAGTAFGSKGRGDLTAHAITEQSSYVEVLPDGSTNTVNSPNRLITPNMTPVSYSTTATPGFGWYLDLPTSKERMVLTPLVIGKFVSFVTSIPDNGACSGAGTGWLMAAEIFSGEQPDIHIFNHVNADSAGVPLDNISGGMVTLDNKYIGADSVGDIITIDATWQTVRPSRRASWSVVR